jgi:aminoglycoside phosphotransferase family enzyme/predicted kinase
MDTDVVEGLARTLGGADLRETHMSWVLLTADRAYKLKKPVRFDFLDLTDPSARRRACEEEVRVNRDLAADVVLGVRGVVRRDGAWALADDGEEDAVDWVVEMRRFDEEATMASAVRRGDLRDDDVRATARRIAAFHAVAARPAVRSWAGAVADTWRVNAQELGGAAGTLLEPERLEAARAFAAGEARRRALQLDRRAADGRVVDGHGDLRAEHVLLGGDAITIVDRLEFDEALRRVDVADDLAFLAMDLRSLGADAAARTLLRAYRDAGGDPGDDGLVAAFGAYRALVRAKVGFLRAAQVADAAAEAARDGALRLVALAERLAWAARGPFVVIVAGPPASGKSSLAAALAEAGGLPVLSSDALRKELLGIAPGAQAPAEAYTPEARREVYGALGARAAAASGSGSVVVDATFGDAGQVDAFLAALGDDGRARIRVIACDAPLEVRLERARARAQRGGSASDAGPDVVARLPSAGAELPVAPERRLTVQTTEPPERLAPRVAAWLDREP